MSDAEREQLELEKLRAEINKLESEAIEARGAQVRGWITAVSISVGIIVTVFQLYRTLSDISLNNRQLAMESQIRSHQLFLNEVLDRMSGIKTVHNRVNKKGLLQLEGNETYGNVTQVGSYGSATALACEFPNLRFPAEVALAYQHSAHPQDIGAATMLKRLQAKCPPGWDSMTNEEQNSWFETMGGKPLDAGKK